MIELDKQEFLMVPSLIDEESRQLVLNSPFCDQAMIERFFEILSKCCNKKTAAQIESFLIKGFTRTLIALKGEYMAILKKMSLNKPVFRLIIEQAGRDVETNQHQGLFSLLTLEL